MRRSAMALGIALFVALPALAGARDDLARAIGDARASGQPVFDLYRELAVSLPQGRIEQSDIAAALSSAGVKDGEPLAKFFAGATSIERKGDRVEILRPEEVGVPLEGDKGTEGWMWLEDEVSFRVRKDGDVVIVDKFDGVHLSEKKDSMRGRPFEIRYEKDAKGQRIARLKAGLGIFSQTSIIDLEPDKPAPATNTPGMSGGIPR